MSCGVGRRLGSDPVLLWLWRRLVAAALVGPLAWKPPYAMGVAQEQVKRPKKKKSSGLGLREITESLLQMMVRSAKMKEIDSTKC